MLAGLSETLEVQEKYAHLQEEQLDNLKDDLVSCIHGEEGQGGDDDDFTHTYDFNFAFLMMMTNPFGLKYHVKVRFTKSSFAVAFLLLIE